jgi:hypothetical protein
LIQLSDQEGFWDWFQVEEVRNWIKKLLSPIWHELSLDDILKSDLSGDELSFLRRVSLIGENENLNSPDAALGYLRTSLLLLEYNSLNRLHKVLHSLLEETNWDDTKLMAKYKEVGMQKMHIREYLNGRPEGSKL